MRLFLGFAACLAINGHGTRAFASDVESIPSPATAGTSPRLAHVVIGIERAVGGSHWAIKDDRTWTSADPSGSAWRAPWTWDEPPPAWVYRAPRLAIDAVIAKRFTAGLAGFLYAPEIPLSGRRFKATTWGLSPRAGVLACALEQERLCFWGKVGMTYARVVGEETWFQYPKVPAGSIPTTVIPTDINLLSVDVEPTVVVTLLPHAAVTFTVPLNLPLWGRTENGNATGVFHVGAFLGVTAWW
jgi:hypothetical protein